MRKFKFVDDESYKFWNIELAGFSYTVAWGRIGTKGQSRTKDFASPAEAHKAYDKIIKEKLDEGYVEITLPAPVTSTENVMEKAIDHDFEDLAAHAAYADLLSQQGDPRGEFVQVQLALEDPHTPAAQRKEFQKREEELLKAHAGKWLGELAPFFLEQQGVNEWILKSRGGYKFTFARGWLDMMHVPAITVGFARLLARSPQMRFLKRLDIQGQEYEEPGEFEAGDDVPADTHAPAMYALLRCPYLQNLRVFWLGEPESAGSCHTSGETAIDLVQRMPNLEELYLLAHRVDMNQLFAIKTLPKLRILQIYHNHRYPLEILASNPSLANLTHLLFHPHGLEYDEQPYINRAGVTAIVQSPHLTKLTHVQFRNSNMGDSGCEEIVRSGVLKRLKVLDLMNGCVTDVGAKILASSPDIRNLELLDISNNSLTEDGIAALKKAGIAKLQAVEQYGPPDEEQQYMWMGDPE